jgi:hypothetical protein
LLPRSSGEQFADRLAEQEQDGHDAEYVHPLELTGPDEVGHVLVADLAHDDVEVGQAE